MNEVTNRQVFVLDGSANTAEAVKQLGMNKVYFKYKEPNGKTISTDSIQMGQIRHIRITKPAGAVFKKWVLTIDTASLISGNVGKIFQLFMHFRDFMGYDQCHEKSASFVLSKRMISASSGTPYKVKEPDGSVVSCTSVQMAVAYELKNRINAQYNNGVQPVVAKVVSGNKIEITENLEHQYPTKSKMERRIFPAPSNMYITTNILEGEDASWVEEVAKDSKQRLEGTDNVTFKNNYLVWRMERQAVLDRNEMVLPDMCDPFMPAELVMDGASFETAQGGGEDLYFLDIAYWTQPKDVHAAVNNKEITFCSKTFADLKAIANILGTQIGTDTDIDNNNHAIVFEPKSVLDTASATSLSEE